MSELKCAQKDCSSAAQYIDAGSSYCQDHFQKREQPQGQLSVRWVYLAGLFLWIAIWLWIIGWIGPQSLAQTILPAYAGNKGLLAIPVGMGLVVLLINLCLWWAPKGYAGYETEVKVIEFVERNAGWFLIASGAFLTAASFFLTRPPGALLTPPLLAREGLVAILAFESASLFCLLFVVSLYWTPPNPKSLARLRHLKTVPFTYGVSFFAAAFTALVAAAMS